ncbi:hypothetical protein BKA62DRAFT_761795 [Auriculariales sp. MPI-PUGE-AT-0066]|nr:hypothetical protein BKA62DRAFT_761795 [Auriculariales sp. MPI-PUGE-AT-0066]
MSPTSLSSSSHYTFKKSAVGTEVTSIAGGGHDNPTTQTTGTETVSQPSGQGSCWSPRQSRSSIIPDKLFTSVVDSETLPNISTGLNAIPAPHFIVLIIRLILAIFNIATRPSVFSTTASPFILVLGH